MNGNPFYVHPGGDMTRGLAGIGQTLGQIGEQRRADAEKAEAKAVEERALEKFNKIKAEAQEVLKTRDPDLINEFVLRNPAFSQAVKMSAMSSGQDVARQTQIYDSAYKYIDAKDEAGREQVMDNLTSLMNEEGVSPKQRSDIESFLQKHYEEPEKALTDAKLLLVTGDNERWNKYAEAMGIGGKEEEKPAETIAFETLIKDFSPEDQEKAKKIKAGLTARAVGSSDMTIQQLGIADLIGDVRGTINERAKFGEMQGSQRSQAIDKGFEKVTKLQQNIVNLDNAIDAVRAGAGTGAIEKRFPSIKESSVLLDQVQGALALDVIGSVTFGALSEGELNLAKAIAIPTGLEGPALEEWLLDKKQAQEKLLNYFKEQIDFLDQGGSVAGFLRKKSREAKDSSSKTIKFDAQGNIIQ